ncbi:MULTISPECIES: hypothetical protein [unclassified Pseudofrankia]|uniref:hypothetical protein n=1 Tax=unclassified Pseudofrankia TaxID=2994372 RepID=UPI0008D98A0A|nr:MULTISPECIES: hypothetical protein [unclassified Pseudofrankia]MDT3438143.1 ABC transporter permease [Pseudofrankia sp. BMG5.37]OHV56892.1 hypothetical protein BCD48_07280 [Pseudofrankia sp. BMG5.36]
MRDALRAEWTKIRTVRTTGAWAAATVVAAVALSCLVAAAVEAGGCAPEATGCADDPTALSLSGVYLAQAAVVVFAVTAVTAEYETGLARVTLAACPRRSTVYLARAAVVTAAVSAVGLVAMAGACLAGRAVLAGGGMAAPLEVTPPGPADLATSRAVVGTALYLCLLALLCLGVGTALRHSGATVAAVLALLLVPAAVAAIVPFPPRVLEAIQRSAPMTAGLAVRATVEPAGGAPIGPWAGLGVFAGYAGTASLLGWWTFRHRDA